MGGLRVESRSPSLDQLTTARGNTRSDTLSACCYPTVTSKDKRVEHTRIDATLQQQQQGNDAGPLGMLLNWDWLGHCKPLASRVPHMALNQMRQGVAKDDSLGRASWMPLSANPHTGPRYSSGLLVH